MLVICRCNVKKLDAHSSEGPGDWPGRWPRVGGGCCAAGKHACAAVVAADAACCAADCAVADDAGAAAAGVRVMAALCGVPPARSAAGLLALWLAALSAVGTLPAVAWGSLGFKLVAWLAAKGGGQAP